MASFVSLESKVCFHREHATSISCNSSGLKGGLCNAPKFFCICATELAPMITLVTLLSFSIHPNDISANDCPRRSAISLRASICSLRLSVSASFLRCPPCAIRESLGIPSMYLPASRPCANGENTMNPAPFSWA